MAFDRPIVISAAGSRKAAHWPEQRLWWSELIERLLVPARGAETQQDYLKLSKAQQDDLKDVGGYVAGRLAGGRRKASAVLGRDLLTLDLDNIPAGGTDDVLRKLSSLGCAWAVYSTRKHHPAAPRLRALFPLDREARADEYEPVLRKLAERAGLLEMCDPSTFEACRLMYWPSCSADGEYVFTYADAGPLSADGVLALYTDWRDMSSWPVTPRAAHNPKQLALKQGDPATKPGVVGAFCRVYDVVSAMDKYLPGVYEEVDADRYTFTGGSTAGGAVVYDDGKFLFSHHATDPCSGKLVNAFDLVRLHLFGDEDDAAKDGTPVNKLPSYSRMCQLAVADAEVGALMRKERYDAATDVFKPIEQEGGVTPDEASGEWLSKLKISPANGQPDKCSYNVALMLDGDPLLKGRVYKDTFASRTMGVAPLPWPPRNTQKGTFIWSDDDDAGLRDYTHRLLGFRSEQVIDDGLRISAAANGFNPVERWLTGLVWDGVPRLDTVFIDYFGAEDCAYTRAVTRKAFVAAVARGIEEEVKFDVMLVLRHLQGTFKSTFFRRAGGAWFSDSVISFEGKDGAELIQSIWIAEIAELHGMSKSDINAVKQFLSRTNDQYRAAYGRRVEVHPRRCVFFGTTNDREYLQDPTGNRRFWPVDGGITHSRKSVIHDWTTPEIEQVWAEAVMRWRLGEPLHLSPELEAEAEKRREAHTVRDPLRGMIEDFVERPVPSDWYDLTLEQHLAFWGGRLSGHGDLVKRDRVCAAEIIRECVGDRRASIDQRESRRVNAILSQLSGWEPVTTARFGTTYGTQRGYRSVKGATTLEA